MGDTVIESGRCGALDWAVYATAYPGQRHSGDAFLVQETEAGVLLAVVDGLGHGDEAADVAEQALVSVRRTAGQSPVAAVTACHLALRGTRGVVMTLAALDVAGQQLAWVAVGNVEAAIVRGGRTGEVTSHWMVPLRGGVVGDRLPPLVESTVALETDDILVSATDGLAPAFVDGVEFSMEPLDLARALHNGFAKVDDDALVLVARCAPISPPSR